MDEIKTAIRKAIEGKDVTRLPADSLFDFLQPKCTREQFRRAFQEVMQPPEPEKIEAEKPAAKPAQ